MSLLLNEISVKLCAKRHLLKVTWILSHLSWVCFRLQHRKLRRLVSWEKYRTILWMGVVVSFVSGVIVSCFIILLIIVIFLSYLVYMFFQVEGYYNCYIFLIVYLSHMLRLPSSIIRFSHVMCPIFLILFLITKWPFCTWLFYE